MVYSYLCETTSNLPRIHNYNMAISQDETLSIPFSSNYASVNSQNDNPISIKGEKLNSFLNTIGLDCIDLLKMNIEGAETDVLNSISDFSMIKRFIISCHDFRANRGEGEYFRTKDKVIKILESNNYIIKSIKLKKYPSMEWKISIGDWVYAEKKD